MGKIKATLIITATILSALSFFIMINSKFAVTMPNFLTQNPLATISLGLLLLCISAWFDN